MSRQAIVQHRYNIHGQSAVIDSAVESFDALLARAMGVFKEGNLPEGFARIHGTVVPYDEADVLRTLSPTAQLVPQSNPLIELYRDDQRYFVIDDRWGMCELNLLRATFRTWIVDHPAIDRLSALDVGVMWPVAQLFRSRGLYLVPATGVARGDFGLMILSPYSVEGELRELVKAGFSILGQSWLSLREEEGRVAMLQMPGHVQRSDEPTVWTDLTSEYPGSTRHHAFVRSIAVVEPVRRTSVAVRGVLRSQALPLLRRVWPIMELSHGVRARQILPRLAQSTRCFNLQLSRDPAAILPHLETLRDGGAIAA